MVLITLISFPFSLAFNGHGRGKLRQSREDEFGVSLPPLLLTCDQAVLLSFCLRDEEKRKKTPDRRLLYCQLSNRSFTVEDSP